MLPVLPFGSAGPPPPAAVPVWAALVDPDACDSAEPITIQHVAQSVLKAKRIAVLCGAGISCASGIPDFRSSTGLFETLKQQHPEARLSSGKDLFDASLFSSESNVAIFYTMIAELKTMADLAEPTAFHELLKSLDDEGKLFRVYTQNIDGLEEKVGLSYGLGSRDLDLSRRKSSPSKSRATTVSPSKPSTLVPTSQAATPTPPPTIPLVPLVFEVPIKRRLRSSLSPSASSTASSPLSSLASSPSGSPPPPSMTTRAPPTPGTLDAFGIPRCIPLHGTLSTLYCPHCSHVTPLTPSLSILRAGSSFPCPACTETDTFRRGVGERSRGIGRMKPDVVLYGESHKEGERVGDITRRDLMGTRPDLLLVVGTSLKVPGTRLLVRELSKVIRPIVSEPPSEDDEDSPTPSASTSSPKKRAKKVVLPKVIYLNFDFPTPSKEWQGIFDIWARGDVQEFVAIMQVEKERLAVEAERRRVAKELAAERKATRERIKAESESAEEGKGKGKGKAKVVKKPVKKTVVVRPSSQPLSRVTSNESNVSSTSSRSSLRKIKSTAGAGSLRNSKSKVGGQMIALAGNQLKFGVSKPGVGTGGGTAK